MSDGAAWSLGASSVEARPDAMSAAADNVFLAPLLRRARDEPSRLFAAFYEGGCWREVSLGEFIDLSRRAAAAFKDLGIVPGDLVFVILKDGLEARAAFLGAMLIGAVPSFLPFPSGKVDHQSYWRQQRVVFEHGQPRCVLAYDELCPEIADLVADLDIVVIPQSAVSRSTRLADVELRDAHLPALLQHSSGTTGLKKGVELSYRAIHAQIATYGEAIGVGRLDAPVVASWLPLYHDMGLFTAFLMPLQLDIPVACIDPFTWVARPSLLLDAVERYAATHVWLPNFAFQHLVRVIPPDAHYDLSSLAALIDCSEPCKARTLDIFLARFGRCGLREGALATSYGMAENVFALTQSPFGRPPRRLALEDAIFLPGQPVRVSAAAEGPVTMVSNGPPITGCEVSIRHEGRDVGVEHYGEICLRSPFLFSGYFRNDDATAAAMDGDWYRSGDLGFLEGGEVFVSGRIKDVVIVNGRNVFAHDVEGAVAGIEGLRPGRLTAFGFFSDAVGSEELVVVAERVDDEPSATQLAREVNRRVLAAVGLPCGDVRIVEPGWLVKTSSGKISRYENARRYGETFRAVPRAHSETSL